ncbi:hypothetical protein AVEN_220219-1 [Araneus ventricosus]|uniref:Uncharacterized protein n=1 Tax=Araneus ventricosus TaxID=182803 RepID=A0A4Y2K621_ARAVE|nr:hypothetical protein AVEN_220219-1 [Araneus ventricosus]
MPFSKDIALDILGLPTFATADEIVFRYKVLSLMWYPENHHNREFALQEFSNVSEAAVRLIFPEKDLPRKLTLPEMYGFFQYIFFRNKDKDKDCCEYVSDDSSVTFEDAELEKEIQADDNASELIMEEEREKNKAEKRRAKKKRRKERKKLEKLEKESSTEKNGTSNSKPVKQKIQDPKSSESEEDFDTSSAFVSVVARKHKKVPDIEIKENRKRSNSAIPKEDPQSVVLRSRQLAVRGNEMANLGYYSEAAELFSESIKLDPTDHRFYGNRSYCYDRLTLFEK